MFGLEMSEVTHFHEITQRSIHKGHSFGNSAGTKLDFMIYRRWSTLSYRKPNKNRWFIWAIRKGRQLFSCCSPNDPNTTRNFRRCTWWLHQCFSSTTFHHWSHSFRISSIFRFAQRFFFKWNFFFLISFLIFYFSSKIRFRMHFNRHLPKMSDFWKCSVQEIFRKLQIHWASFAHCLPCSSSVEVLLNRCLVRLRHIVTIM